jgi:mRNA-degrading endonuclease RelE of RelBE toxin-antitoxin system
MPPLEIDFSPQYRRRARQLSEDQRRQAADAADSLREAFGSPHRHSGLGIRRLSGNLYEFRVGRDLRVVFELNGSRAEFVLIGNHDDVRRYLKNF